MTIKEIKELLKTIPDNHPVEFVVGDSKLEFKSISYGGVISTTGKEPVIVPAIIYFDLLNT